VRLATHFLLHYRNAKYNPLDKKNNKSYNCKQNIEGANMLWRKGEKDIRNLEAELSELRKDIKKLESENSRLSGQVTIYKAARDFMNLLFYRIPACVMVTDDKGRIMKVSQHLQDLIDTPEFSLVGKYTNEICARVDDLIKTQEYAFELKTHNQDVTKFKSLLIHHDGSEVPVSSDITFVQDENGKTLGAVAVVTPRA
jgi:PAS domain S-box-containing protein